MCLEKIIYEKKAFINLFFVLIFSILIISCKSVKASDKIATNNIFAEIRISESIKKLKNNREEKRMKMKVKIGNSVFTAVLEKNSSVEALKELLNNNSLTLTMNDYGGMEKTADLGVRLPQNNRNMNTQAGDIILYQGRTFVIYYGTNSWSLTPIGKIENLNVSELRKALGRGDVVVTISIE